MWEYYGEGILGRIQAWIFTSRIKVVIGFLKKAYLEPKKVVDIGCGPMLISYAFDGNAASEYVGIDIMQADMLKKYRDAMRDLGAKNVEVIRGSAEALPFKAQVFDFALSLDVFEHLNKPKKASGEVHG